MKGFKKAILFLVFAFLIWLPVCVQAQGNGSPRLANIELGELQLESPGLSLLRTFTGNYGVSTDGFGSISNSGTIMAKIPANSTIMAAYLYSAAYSHATYEEISIDGLTFNNTAVTFDKIYKNQWDNSGNAGFFKTGRADVTDLVRSAYSSMSPSSDDVYYFQITEQHSEVDGEALVVVYENNSLPTTTIAVLDGGANILGDTTQFLFTEQLDPSSSGFTAEMFLGISFSYPDQSSKITVNNTVITENAGGYDDGAGGNGGLITTGGFDDNYSPLLPSYSNDTERYNIADYISFGDTSVTVETINPSRDDNLFLVVFNISGTASVHVTPVDDECYTAADLQAAKQAGYDQGYQEGLSQGSTTTPSDSNCVTQLSEDMGLDIPCLYLNGTYYHVVLDYYQNPNDPFSLYWKFSHLK